MRFTFLCYQSYVYFDSLFNKLVLVRCCSGDMSVNTSECYPVNYDTSPSGTLEEREV